MPWSVRSRSGSTSSSSAGAITVTNSTNVVKNAAVVNSTYGGGWGGAEGALPRRWIALDFDQIEEIDLNPIESLEQGKGYRAVDARVHVHDFIDMHDLGDMLSACGYAEPVMDMEFITVTYADVDALIHAPV